MSIFSTRELLQLLPMSEETRQRLLELYPDSYSYETKNQIESDAWDLYGAYRDTLVNQKVQDHVASGQPLPEGYEDTYIAQVEQELRTALGQKKDTEELASVRDKINTIMSSYGNQ